MNENKKFSEISVRGIAFKLFTFNRSLELCARMNYEVEILDFIDSLEPNSLFYDLGSCEGRFSIYAAKKGHRVISFEPNKANYRVLQMNLELNELEKNVLSFNLGVGEKNQQALLQIGQPWPGGHQKIVKHDEVRADLNFSFVESEIIEVVSLDSFVASKSLSLPDAIKIDIDGSEVPFLKGAKKTLAYSHLKKVIFELDKSDRNFNYICEVLIESGFIVIESFQVPNEPTLFNFLFVRP